MRENPEGLVRRRAINFAAGAVPPMVMSYAFEGEVDIQSSALLGGVAAMNSNLENSLAHDVCKNCCISTFAYVGEFFIPDSTLYRVERVFGI